MAPGTFSGIQSLDTFSSYTLSEYLLQVWQLAAIEQLVQGIRLGFTRTHQRALRIAFDNGFGIGREQDQNCQFILAFGGIRQNRRNLMNHNGPVDYDGCQLLQCQYLTRLQYLAPDFVCTIRLDGETLDQQDQINPKLALISSGPVLSECVRVSNTVLLSIVSVCEHCGKMQMKNVLLTSQQHIKNLDFLQGIDLRKILHEKT